MSSLYDGHDDVRRYESVDGRHVHLNLGQGYAFARPVSLDELVGALASFRRLQMEWFRNHMTSVTNDKNVGGYPQIVGTKGNFAQHKGGIRHFNLSRFLTIPVPDFAWSVLAHSQPNGDGHRSCAIPFAPADRQIQFVEAILADGDILSMTRVLRPGMVAAFVYPDLEPILSESADASSFVAAVDARAAVERAPREDVRNTAHSVMKSVIPDAFLFFLSQKGLILRPLRPRTFVTESYGIEMWLMDRERRDLWDTIKTSYAAISKAAEAASSPTASRMKRGRLWERDLLQTFLVVLSSSEVRSLHSISAPLFYGLFEALDQIVNGNHQPDMLTRIFKAMRDRLPLEQQGLAFEPRRSKWGDRERFEWTRMVFGPSTRPRFPDKFVGPYSPKQSILAWVDAFEATLARVGSKNLNNHKVTANVFLHWLAVTGNASSGVNGLIRADINDGKASAASASFRAFLDGRAITVDAANSHLSRLSTMFDHMIAELDAPIPNPVVLRFDVQRLQVRRGKTPRRSLGRDMLDYIREFNARDDFAFSKAHPSHYRVLYDRDAERYEKVWFPGVPRAIDILLRLPLRGFQVRYLDSGEGDEFVPDFSQPCATMTRNDSPRTTKGRRQGVLTLINGVQGEPILGLFINTNKTGFDRQEGYEIPWCEDRLRESILEMAGWQARWNPVQQPVMCVEKKHGPKNPEVAAAIQRTYALFRDPSESEGWPISRDAIYRYWDDLCAAVEDELSSSDVDKAPVRLTDAVITNKGNGKTERRRQARYDIHTLRVSGISALIEAGMPPDLVSQVAGHASIVMTLYYNVVSASALNERLKSALLRTSTNLDALDALRDDDFEKVAEFLVNRRSEEDSAGLSMLKERMGHGDGSFDVMSHGICPGGDCASGGEWTNQAVGHLGVPRPLACSLCRYRLTGPMFLPGLVLNANRLMHELRRKGQEIADLNAERQALGTSQVRRAAVLKGRIEALYRETGVIAEEWAAEVQYVHLAKDLLEAYVAADTQTQLPVLIGGTDKVAVAAKLEARSDFALLQSLSEGSSTWVGFRPSAALSDHREFLNEVLAANGIEPFLLRLSGRARDDAANLLGRTIVAMVPDGDIDALRTQNGLLGQYPAVVDTMARLRDEACRALPACDAQAASLPEVA